MFMLINIIYETFVPPFREFNEEGQAQVFLTTRSNKRKAGADGNDTDDNKLTITNPCSFRRMLALAKFFAKTLFVNKISK